MNRALAAAAVAAAALALAACEADAPKQTPPSPPPTQPAASAAGGPVLWKDMDRDARMKHMKTVVFPRMKAEFVKADPDEFKDMKCVTCHGDGARGDQTFKMPNPKLPKLPMDDEGFKKLSADEPAMMEFMAKTVVPQMAEMLGEKPYDHATQQGFGCFRCHTPK